MRFLILCGLVTALGLAQGPSVPCAIVEPAPYRLDPWFDVFVTDGGRILAHSPALASGDLPQIAIWEGLTGFQLLNSLHAPDSERPIISLGCGLCCGGGPGTTVSSNQPDRIWDPVTHAFLLPAWSDVSPMALTESGGLLPAVEEEVPLAQVEILGKGHLRVRPPFGGEWEIQRPTGIPGGAELTPLQRALCGGVGFERVLASRDGAWVITTWFDAVPDGASPRRPYVRAPHSRIQVWRRGSSLPALDLPLEALVGVGGACQEMILSRGGDRVIFLLASRVVVFDPTCGRVVMNREGTFVKEIPEAHAVVFQTISEFGDRFSQADLEDGRILGAIVVPETLDPRSPADPAAAATLSGPQPTQGLGFRRLLSWPLAFSPDGRYMVTARNARPNDQEWDGLVLWEFRRD